VCSSIPNRSWYARGTDGPLATNSTFLTSSVVPTGAAVSKRCAKIAPLLDAEAEVRWLSEVELADADGLTALRGASALFRAIPSPYRAVVTSGGRALAAFRLAAVGLTLPDVLISAEDVQRGKPAPDGYLLAAQRLGVDPSECIVIEDTPAGIAAGRAAGATVLAVSRRFQRRSSITRM
jgi:HAD superfamily hydrolase (TIGR01509 family)